MRSFCENVVEEGVELPCNHLACASCCCNCLEIGVPCCLDCFVQFTDTADMHPMPSVVQGILKELQLQCDNFSLGCPAILNFQKLAKHVSTCDPSRNAAHSLAPAVTRLTVSPSSCVSLPSTPPRPSLASNTPTATLMPSKIAANKDRPVDTPLTGAEKRAVTHLVKCAISENQSTSGGQKSQVLELATGAQ